LHHNDGSNDSEVVCFVRRSLDSIIVAANVRKDSRTIRIVLGDNLWTRAVVDGSVAAKHFPIEFHSNATLSDRLHGVKQGKWDGCDGTLTDYLLEKEQSRGVPKVALPIFMLGGFRQRTLLMRRGDASVKDLRARRVLLPRVLTPGGVYMRGFLADEYGLERDGIAWHAIHSAVEDADRDWIQGRLDKPEGFEAVLAAAELLSRGEFDALIHPGGHGFYSLFGGDKMIGGTLKRFPDLFEPLGNAEEIAAWFRRTKIYPIVHVLQLRTDCLDEHRGLAEELVEVFTEAWSASEARLDINQRELLDKEREILEFDAYRYELGEIQQKTIGKLMDYLQADGLLSGRFTMKEIFPFSDAL
jgi:4,5-dihydroxyphthalate decarboxylase